MSYYLDILKKNFGFRDPNKWLEYARSHNFTLVGYKEVNDCPYCQSISRKQIGQFVYYSTLHSLKECNNCGLCHVDVLIDESVRYSHFEISYKSDEYFKNNRKAIFLQTLSLISKENQSTKTILELGGATGELGLLMKAKFPGSRIIINDISQKACILAQEKGLETINGPVSVIANVSNCTTILALDVLYYEPKFKEALDLIYSQLESNGVLIIRLPNKYPIIKVFQRCLSIANSIFSSKSDHKLQSTIKFFNPEHIYVFSQKFLLHALTSAGFASVRFEPSVLLENDNSSFLSKITYILSDLVFSLTGKVIGPAMFVVAKKG